MTQNSFICKLEGAEVNYLNGTIIVDQDFGRSLVDGSDFLVSGEEKIYNFMTYPSKQTLGLDHSI